MLSAIINNCESIGVQGAGYLGDGAPDLSYIYIFLIVFVVLLGVLAIGQFVFIIVAVQLGKRTVSYQYEGHTITVKTIYRRRELYVDNELVDEGRVPFSRYGRRTVKLRCMIDEIPINVVVDVRWFRPIVTLFIGTKTIEL